MEPQKQDSTPVTPLASSQPAASGVTQKVATAPAIATIVMTETPIAPQAETVQPTITQTTPVSVPKTTEELLTELTKKIEHVETMVATMKRRSTISMWLTIIFVVLPIVGSIFALPYLMNQLTSSMGLGDLSGLQIESEDTTGTMPAAVPGKQVSDTELLKMLHDLQSKVDNKSN